MMTVLIRNNLQVATNVLTQSMNMAVNSTMETLLELTYLRKLDPADLYNVPRKLDR